MPQNGTVHNDGVKGTISEELKKQVDDAMQNHLPDDFIALNALYDSGDISEADYYAACIGSLDAMNDMYTYTEGT